MFEWWGCGRVIGSGSVGSSWLRRVGYLGPRGFRWVVGHSVFRIAVIEDFEASFELRAFSAPTGVLFVIAVGAEFGLVGGAC